VAAMIFATIAWKLWSLYRRAPHPAKAQAAP
jgi:hypothetical protein